MNPIGQNMKWFQNLREIFYSLRHRYRLAQLNSFVQRGYIKGEAKLLGKPLYADQEDQWAFDSYFRTRHFEKNFYTNYHALWKLFCSVKKIKTPQRFYVYDIACGPYTASVSLLNFLQGNGGLKRKSVSFNFCDKGNLAFEKFCEAGKNKALLSFPVSSDFLEIDTTFKLREWNVCMNQCPHGQWEDCKPYKEISPLKGSGDISPDGDAVNLIFLSYPGTYYNRKFIRCAEKVISGFSTEQKAFPTYIIYSHYDGKDEVENDMRNAEAFRVKSVITNEDRPVPFKTYYYHIFEVEAADEIIPF